MLVPKLRFKRDDGTDYPDWEKGHLDEITEKVSRTADNNSKAPVMMISQGNGFIHQSEKYSRDNAGQSLAKYTLLKYGEMAYNHGASKTKPYGVAYCLQEEKEARIPFVYHSFRITNGVSKYWNYSLNTSQMDRQLKKMVSSGARMDGLLNINYDTYMQTQIFKPHPEEQQKIADFLSTVDEVITQSEQEVQNLEQQKKAAMQKIFSQEVRFKREDGTDYPEWEETSFGETCSGFEYGMNAAACNFDGVHQYIRITDIDDMSRRYMSENAVSPNGEMQDKYIVNVNDILFARTGASVGKAYLYRECDGLLYYAGFLIRANVNEHNNACFVFSQTLTYDYWNWVKLTSMRTGQQGINAQEYKEYKFFAPCLEEQQKIADFLSAYDKAITYAKQELDKWKQLKKGLLQQMFV